MLFTGQGRSVWEKNCALGLGTQDLGHSFFFLIRTFRPVNNIYSAVESYLIAHFSLLKIHQHFDLTAGKSHHAVTMIFPWGLTISINKDSATFGSEISRSHRNLIARSPYPAAGHLDTA